MKVLMTVGAVGGVWTYAVELIRPMAEHKFIIAVMGPAPSAWQRADLPGNVRLVERDCKLEWMSDPWQDVAHAYTSPSDCRSWRPRWLDAPS